MCMCSLNPDPSIQYNGNLDQVYVRLMFDPDWVFVQVLYTDRHTYTLTHMLPSLCPTGLHSFQSMHSLRQVFLVRSKGFFPLVPCVLN